MDEGRGGFGLANFFDIQYEFDFYILLFVLQLEEYVLHPEVHENNRLVAEKFIEYRNHKTAVTVQSMTHPALKKPFAVFTVSKTED